MPQLPRGMMKRKVKTKRGTRDVYYSRRREHGKDVWRSLGSDYGLALTRFRRADLVQPDASVISTSPSLEAFSIRWLAEYATTKRTKRGRDQAEQRLRDYVWPTLGDMPLAELKPADLRRLTAEMSNAGVGLVTQRRALEDVRCMLRYATEEAEVITKSPWRRGIIPTLPEAAPKPLSDEELAEVVRTVPEKWRPVVQFLAYTGLRWGELRSLRWSDVRDLPHPYLVIGRSHDGPTKSRRVREVPLIAEAQAVLSALPRHSGYVFTGRRAERLGENASFLRRFVAENSSVKGFHVHRLRHTFARLWLESGRRLEALQSILGHSTIRLTERYGRLSAASVAAEARKPSKLVAEYVAVKGSIS
jgi:integrase